MTTVVPTESSFLTPKGIPLTLNDGFNQGTNLPWSHTTYIDTV